MTLIIDTLLAISHIIIAIELRPLLDIDIIAIDIDFSFISIFAIADY
jgi:hypothetical protein